MGENEPDRLESWKEIATFVGRTERTAMRWAEEGMPVRKVRGRIIASRAEIKNWLSSHPDNEPASEAATTPLDPERTYSRKKFVLFGAALIVTLVLAALLILSSHHTVQRSVPSKITFRDSGFDAFDVMGRHLWSYSFFDRLDPEIFPISGDYQSLNELVRIDDFWGNGDREILMILPFSRGANPHGLYVSEAKMFSSQGKLLWSYFPQKTYTFGEHILEGPWNILNVFVSDRKPKKSIWIAAVHYVWGNSFVAQLDATTGLETVRFVNTGSIRALNEMKTAHGTYLLAGGFNNEYDTGSVAVIDENKPFAISPQTAGTRHKCMSCETGDPDYYFVFPRSEINLYRKVHENSVQRIDVSGDGIEVFDDQLLNIEGVESIYSLQLQPTVQVTSLRYGSDYDMLHRELSVQKALDHSLENCPERLYPKPVRMWTPFGGWLDLSVKPAKASN